MARLDDLVRRRGRHGRGARRGARAPAALATLAEALAAAPLAALAALAGLAACTAPPLTRDEVVAEVAARPLPPVLITWVAPPELAKSDAAARLPLVVEVSGREVAELELCDRYFKAIIATTEELRALGIRAAADPALWRARLDGVAAGVADLDEASLLLHLTRAGAQEDVPALYELDIEQKRRVLASRLVVLAARTALPAARRVERASGRYFYDTYFSLDGPPTSAAPLRLEVLGARALASAPALDAEGEPEGPGRQEARLALRFRLGPEPVAGVPREVVTETERTAEATPSGVSQRLGSYQVALGDDPPLDRCFREAVLDFVRAWLADRALDAAPASP